ncbi:MAG: EAL domain-containing protein [Gammaproteobacteria bacterium]|nr:EAL domain-containing protein [Gammaproteobacteria bacterium]
MSLRIASALLHGALTIFICGTALAAEPTVVFGGSRYYPPFHYADADTGADGFDVAVFREIARRNGWASDFRFDDWGTIQQALVDGQVSVVPMFVSTERSQRYLFSDPINIEYHQFFGASSREAIRNFEGLAGTRIATETAAYASAYLQDLGNGAILVPASSEAEALRMVVRGEADLALIPAHVAQYTIANEKLTQLHELSPPVLPVTYAFAVTPARPGLLDGINSGLQQMERDGTLRALREQWFLRTQNNLPSPLKALVPAAAAGLLLGGFALRVWRRRRRAADTAVLPDAGLRQTAPAADMEAGPPLLDDLKLAIESDALTWVYQPQFGIHPPRIIGAEMLVRWQHPEQGFIPPDHFIGLAERHGLIRAITKQAINQAAKVLRKWSTEGHDYTLSINVSANDLADPDLVADIVQAMHGLERRLTLEVTETAIMQDITTILQAVEKLKACDIKLALDDYGTGYSSMSYLKEFNFDEIKIDRIFTGDIATNERNMMLTRASARLGHELGAQVVAEGVETMPAASLLVELGCDILQGYLISRPIPLDEFDRFAANAALEIPRSGNAGSSEH